MNDPLLRNLLEQLQGELKQADGVDDQGRELLRSLETEIHQFLERAKDEPVHSSFTQSLEDAITHFEVTHPALTRVLSDMLTTLSNAGV